MDKKYLQAIIGLEIDAMTARYYIDWMLKHGKFDRDISGKELNEMYLSVTKTIRRKYPEAADIDISPPNRLKELEDIEK